MAAFDTLAPELYAQVGSCALTSVASELNILYKFSAQSRVLDIRRLHTGCCKSLMSIGIAVAARVSNPSCSEQVVLAIRFRKWNAKTPCIDKVGDCFA